MVSLIGTLLYWLFAALLCWITVVTVQDFQRERRRYGLDVAWARVHRLDIYAAALAPLLVFGPIFGV